MESENSPEKVYKNKSKTHLDLDGFRKVNEAKYLTLRKKKRNNDLKLDLKNKYTLYEHHYIIHLNQLKTDNDDIRNFYINKENPVSSIEKLKYLLNSKIDDEVKYGIYAVNSFFKDIVRMLQNFDINDNQVNNAQILNNLNIIINGEKYPLDKIDKIEIINKEQINLLKQQCNDYLEVFLEYDIINYLFEIIKNNLNINEKRSHINIYECFCIFINMSGIDLIQENYKVKFYSTFIQTDNLLTIFTLLNPQKYPQEIILNVLILLLNITVEYPQIIESLIKSSLTPILLEYLKSVKYNNPKITTKIIKLLYFLYIKYKTKLELETYKTLFQVFSLFVQTINNNDDVIKYCLELLKKLSGLDVDGLIQYFDDTNLLSALYNIIANKPIKDNELNILNILEIFDNIIISGNKKIHKDIIEQGMLLIFYNNLIIKYNEENVEMDYKVESNILMSVNNLVYFNHDNSVEYIFNEGKVILDFFLKALTSIFSEPKKLGIKSFVNILIDIKIDINDEIINEILRAVILSLINNIEKSYYDCCQCLFLIIQYYKKRNRNINNLRIYYINKGVSDLIEKIRTKLLNDQKDDKIEKEDEEIIEDFINEIIEFMK